jgi:hypothetical protein
MAKRKTKVTKEQVSKSISGLSEKHDITEPLINGIKEQEVEVLKVEKLPCDLANEALEKAGYKFTLVRSQFEVLMLVETIPQTTEDFVKLNNLSRDILQRMIPDGIARTYGSKCAATKRNLLSNIDKELKKVLDIVKPFAE